MNMNIIKSGVCGLVAIGMALLLNEPASAGSKPVTTLVSVNSSGVKGNGNSNNPAISSDGRYVAFMSAADNLAGSTNGFWNVFVRDTLTGTTERVSVSYAGGAPMATAAASPSAPTAVTSHSPRMPPTSQPAILMVGRTSLYATAQRARPNSSARTGTKPAFSLHQRGRQVCGLRLFCQQPRCR